MNPFQTKLFRVGIVFLVTLLIALSLLAGARANRSNLEVNRLNKELGKGSAKALGAVNELLD
jgi:hypothetical protein